MTVARPRPGSSGKAPRPPPMDAPAPATQPPPPPPPPPPPADEDALHGQRVLAAFRLHEAEQGAERDIIMSAACSIMYAAALLGLLRQGHAAHGAAAAAAAAAQLLLLAAPGLVAWRARRWYVRRRAAVLACGVAASWLAAGAGLPTGGAGGGGPPDGELSLAANPVLIRALGLNLLPWMLQLPFEWWLPVHLVGVAEAAQLPLDGVCRHPSLTSAAAQRRWAAASGAADRLAHALSAHVSFAPPGGPPAAAPPGSPCSCLRWSLFLLASLGCGLPIACQFLAQTAARRAFTRACCTRRRCNACAAAKGADLPMLAASAALLLAGFCALSWQAVAVAQQAGALPGGAECAAGAA